MFLCVFADDMSHLKVYTTVSDAALFLHAMKLINALLSTVTQTQVAAQCSIVL